MYLTEQLGHGECVNFFEELGIKEQCVEYNPGFGWGIFPVEKKKD